MSEQSSLRVETSKRLSVAQERDIVRAAFARQPDSPILRARLATLHNMCDAFDETIALLSAPSSGADSHGEYRTLALAYLARETEPDTRRARDAAARAGELAESDRDRAAALADQAKAELRLGNVAPAQALLVRALALDAGSKDACKRLAALHLQAGNPAAALALTYELEARGAAHSRLLAARAAALARLGDLDAARAVVGLATFRHRQQLGAPPGWASIGAFNAALAAELLAHPGLHYERYGTASEKTWRIDAPATGAAPLTRMLLATVADIAGRQVDRAAAHDHPWARARPAGGILHSWCVITEQTGFESWHVHQFGWMSGVYYVQVPPGIAQGDGRGGCLAFGLPDDLAGAEAARGYGEELVRPQSGMLLLFPSHAYHRTFPHGRAERRICLAFDIWPA